MNILFLMGIYPSYGGVEKVSTILANEFIDMGYGVSIISFEQPHLELAEQELDKKVQLYKFDYPVYCSQNVKRLRDIIKAENINVIINQWVVPFYVARLCDKAKKGLSCKLISVHHNLPDTNARIKAVEIQIENNIGNKIINKLRLFAVKTISRLSLRYTYEKSDKYIVLSPSFIPILQNYIRIKSESPKLLSISNPLTISRSKNLCFNDKRKEILYVGRIEYNQKRTFRLVDIWKDLSPKHPDWTLTIVGDGPDGDDFRKRVVDSKLSNINIEGFKNPLEYYRRASVIILVSEFEGFPLVLAEAICNGCVPIVLDSYAAVHDIVKPDTGVIVPYPYNKDLFVKLTDKLILDTDSLRQYSGNALRYSQKYLIENIITEWEKLFKAM